MSSLPAIRPTAMQHTHSLTHAQRENKPNILSLSLHPFFHRLYSPLGQDESLNAASHRGYKPLVGALLYLAAEGHPNSSSFAWSSSNARSTVAEFLLLLVLFVLLPAIPGALCSRGKFTRLGGICSVHLMESLRKRLCSVFWAKYARRKWAE